MKLLGKIWRSMGDVERVVRAGGYSVAGLRAALRTEAAFRQLFVLFVILAPLGLWLGNDRISKQRHKLSGRAKDMGSAAGMLSQLLVVFVWAVILWPRIW